MVLRDTFFDKTREANRHRRSIPARIGSLGIRRANRFRFAANLLHLKHLLLRRNFEYRAGKNNKAERFCTLSPMRSRPCL